MNSEHKVWKLVGKERKTDAVLLIKRSAQFFFFCPWFGKTNAKLFKCLTIFSLHVALHAAVHVTSQQGKDIPFVTSNSMGCAVSWLSHLYVYNSANSRSLSPSSPSPSSDPRMCQPAWLHLCRGYVWGINMDVKKVKTSLYGLSSVPLLWDLLSYLIHSFMLWLSQLCNKGFGWFSTEKHRTAAKRSTP